MLTAFVFGVRLDAVQEGHAVVRAFCVGHALSIAAKSDDAGDAIGRRVVERLVHRPFRAARDFRLRLSALEMVPARSRRPHGGRQPYFFSIGHCSGPQVVALQAQARGRPAGVFEAHVVRKHSARHALFQAALAGRRCGRLRGAAVNATAGRKSRRRIGSLPDQEVSLFRGAACQAAEPRVVSAFLSFLRIAPERAYRTQGAGPGQTKKSRDDSRLCKLDSSRHASELNRSAIWPCRGASGLAAHHAKLAS